MKAPKFFLLLAAYDASKLLAQFANGIAFECIRAKPGKQICVKAAGSISFNDGAILSAGAFTVDDNGWLINPAGTLPQFLLASLPALGTQFTIFLDYVPTTAHFSTAGLLIVSDGSSSNQAGFSSQNGIRQRVVAAGATSVNQVGGSETMARHQVAGRFGADDYSISVDGAAAVTQTTASKPLPTGMDRVSLGRLFGTTGAILTSMYVRRLVLIPDVGISNALLPKQWSL